MNTPNVPAYTTNAKTLREFRFHCANVRWRNHLFLGTETDQCQSAELVGDKSTSLLWEGHPEQRAETLCPDATKQRNLGPYVGAERGCTLASRTMKQASVSSTDQGGGKRRSGNRHACGFKLANDGHDTRATQAYLGHCSIISTVRYTALKPNRFKNF